MDIFGKDMIIGNFKLSDYNLMLATFEINDEYELGMDNETIEEFISNNPVPIYLGSKFTNKLKPRITIIKNTCSGESQSFTEHDCREVLRQLTGYDGYVTMQIEPYDDMDELLYFNIRITNVSYKKIAGNVVGVILQAECDSQFAWSKEYNYTYDVSANKQISFFNFSDDLYNYLLPTITIVPKTSIENLEIINLSDNNWTTVISNIYENEIITMDSKNEILLSSNKERIILNDFNYHFFRLVSGQNHILINSDITITIKFRVPRKVGFV